jgi:hypothetical protein
VTDMVVVVGVWWRCWYRGGGGGGCGDDGGADADTDDVEARNTEVAPLSAAALLIFHVDAWNGITSWTRGTPC